MGEVAEFKPRQPPPPPPSGPIPVRTVGANWPAARMGTIPDVSEEPRFDGRDHWARAAVIVCRGRIKWTVVLPCAGEKALPEYLASFTNDNNYTDQD